MRNRRKSMFYLKIIYNILVASILVGLLLVGYLFAYQTFSNDAYDSEDVRTETVRIKKGESVYRVSKQLRKKKLIVGRYQFCVRKTFSKYRRQKFVPGTYRISSADGMEDIIAILTGETISRDERNEP